MAYYLKAGASIQVLGSLHHRGGMQRDQPGVIALGTADAFGQQSLANAMSASFGNNGHEPYHGPFRQEKIGLGAVWPNITYGADYLSVQFGDHYLGVFGVCRECTKPGGEFPPSRHDGC